MNFYETFSGNVINVAAGMLYNIP